MGEIEARGGNFEEARKWYGEAVKLDPKSYLANYYFAVTSMQSGHNDDSAIEPSLHAAIESNPNFAPAYERLAVCLSMQHKNLDEAIQLIKAAVKLDSGNFGFRMNAANVLVTMRKYDDAIAVLGVAVKLARNQQQAEMAESQIENVRQFQQTQARIEQEQREYATRQVENTQQVELVAEPVEEKPKHPDEANGPTHSVLGVMRNVTCSYPAVMELRVEAAGKSYNLYSNDFTRIDITALNFTPGASMNPCKDFEGYKARVRYTESSDKTVDGQVLAIELHK
jgi:tetratricopeptide (TPR) repeat protein